MNESGRTRSGPRFFAVDRTQFHRVCDHGLSAMTAYLVLAAGTGGDHATTSWGVHAIEKYTGLSRGRASEALKLLRECKLLKHRGARMRIGAHLVQRRGLVLPPRTKRHLIWMPTQLVTGTGTEQPPIGIVRELGDPLTLRLLVDLYDNHQLVDHGGINPYHLGIEWKRRRVGERGEWIVWGFRSNETYTRPCELHEPHLTRTINNRRDFNPWWNRLQALINCGLIELIPTLYGSQAEDAQAIMPVGGSTEPEIQLMHAIRAAAESMLTERQLDEALEEDLLLVPVRRHIHDCSVKSVARLRYRPQTKETAKWFARLCRVSREYTDKYQQLAARSGMQGQGLFKETSRLAQG